MFSFTITDSGNNSKTYDDSNIYEYNLKWALCAGDNVDFGECNAAELTATVDNSELIAIGNRIDCGEYKNFTIAEIEYVNHSKRARITAYDSMVKFDKIVDNWVDFLSFPIALSRLIKSLCDYCGVTCNVSGTTLTNGTMQIQDNFSATNITGRQILQYCAQASGTNFSCVTGELRTVDFTQTGVFTPENIYSIERKPYTCLPIEKLTVTTSEDDLGVSAGSTDEGARTYKIINNPLFYTDTTAEIQEQVNTLYNKILNTVRFNIENTPCTISCASNECCCGNIISVTDSDGAAFNTYVTSMEIAPNGIKLIGAGTKERNTSASAGVNAELNALRGKYNRLNRTVEETTSTIGQLNSDYTEIKQTMDSISLKAYDKETGESAQIKIGDITVDIIGEQEVKEQLGVELTGYVKFNDLQESGSTVINGDNITTGTINAERINLTGAIAWSDLNETVQNKINSGDTGANVPDYIQSTYIDSTEIKSPKISGNDVYANSFNVVEYTRDTEDNIVVGAQYGTMGKGTGNDGVSETTGIVLKPDDNHYVIATNKGVRLTVGANSIYLIDKGIYATNGNKTIDILSTNTGVFA